MNNVKEMLKGEAIGKIGKEGGRIIIKTDDGTNIGRIRKILERLPGISNFSFVEEAEMDIDSIFKKAVQVMKEDKLEERYKTFKVIARRTNKDFKLNSPQINSAVGEYILANTSLRVDVHAPDIELNINIGDKKAFIYFEKVAGIGGLPVGSSGKAVCLLSGGIDSPVAAYMMMKRGMRITFVHFKNRSVMGSGEGVDKIKELVGILGGFQGKSKLYIVPFDDFQKEIIANIASKNRMIVYRRIMLRMAGLIAKKEGAGAVVVGDSIGQVASQTIENLSVAYKVIDMPILAPLIGFNKREIIDIASRIGTYDISIIPYQDCCSLMAAKHPETKADPGEIEKQEKNIDMIKIAQDCLSKIEPEII
jgi:thiamine biosynthesis protein ThiI